MCVPSRCGAVGGGVVVVIMGIGWATAVGEDDVEYRRVDTCIDDRPTPHLMATKSANAAPVLLLIMLSIPLSYSLSSVVPVDGASEHEG